MSDISKTQARRAELFRDRWSSYGALTGIRSISDHLTPEQLRKIDLFADDEDRFLERISPDVSIAVWDDNAVLFEQGAYLDLAFLVLDGTVEISLEGSGGATAQGPAPIFDASRTLASTPLPAPAKTDPASLEATMLLPRLPLPSDPHEITFLASMDFDLPRGSTMELGPGELFGEIGAMSGWPQSVTARTRGACRLLQIRVPALRILKRRSKPLRERLDKLYRERALAAQLKSTPLLRHCSPDFIAVLRDAVELVSCTAGEVIVCEGDPIDALYLVRSGFVRLAQRFGEGDLVVSYLSKGMTLGEVELLVEGLQGSEVTATSVEHAELVKIPAEILQTLLRQFPDMEEPLWRSVTERLKETGYSRRNIAHSEFLQTALDTGLVQGNSMLVIDLEACTRCDDCVRACAATHEGRPRFVREGEKVGNLLIARSCYHCRDPVCLVGCPTGAIHRAGVGEVVTIDDPICIGCSTCANNCPYDAIVMHDTGTQWPADTVPETLRGTDRAVASKCDLCFDTGHEPACVSHCPQGCAYRVGSVTEIRELLRD